MAGVVAGSSRSRDKIPASPKSHVHNRIPLIYWAHALAQSASIVDPRCHLSLLDGAGVEFAFCPRNPVFFYGLAE